MNPRMSDSNTGIFIHIIFSTKRRERFLYKDIRTELNAYLGGITKQAGSIPIIFNGVEDHIHGLVILGKNKNISDLVQNLKRASNTFLQEKDPNNFKNRFAWQIGYGAFSVSFSLVPRILNYIQKQEEHHRKRTFEEEMRDVLLKNQINFDEKYLFG
jgi:putative transposase